MIRAFGLHKEMLLQSVERIQARAARAQTQLTTGYRINQPSDSPHDLARMAEIQGRLARSGQIRSNLERLVAEVDSNEAAVGQAVQILEHIRVAGVQAAGSLPSPAERGVLADRVRGWLDDLVRIANSHHGGRYQFSGDRDDVAPYKVDWTAPTGVVRAHNEPDTRVVEDFGGNRFAVSRRAQDIFDARDSMDSPAADNAFAAVYELVMGMETNDLPRISNGLARLEQATVRVSEELMTFGVIQNRVRDALEQARKAETQAISELSDVRDADAAEAITELQQATTSLQAALGAHARMPRSTLFDYLG
jgi:flagellar hook-associated protein 3 FlgL